MDEKRISKLNAKEEFTKKKINRFDLRKVSWACLFAQEN